MSTQNVVFLAFFIKLAVDGAFGSYSEASGGRLASLAYTPAARPHHSPSAKKIAVKNLEWKKISKKFEKILKKKK